ncbi:MAG: SWI/SNF chromatin-remodeling complex subunit [Thelocarpon superellum]|nr:MAG: SWI/SNF chromatin-remodeling complex subunit [Thelocarpon superellum]
MPSPVSSQLPAPPVVATSVPNGSQHGALTPIEAGGPVINAPIDSGILPDERTPDPIGEGKQKAKAVLAAAGVTLPAPSANQSSTPTSLSTSTSTSTSTAPSQTSSARERPTPAPRPTKQALLLDQYTSRDHLNAAALHAQNLSNIDAIHAKRIEVDLYKGPVKRERQQNPGAIFGHGYAGFGNGHTDGKTRVIYPFQRRRPGGRRTRELRIPRKDMATQADQIEELIPVRLDVDWDKIKLRDTFTWNLHDRVISPELFAEQLVEDFKLPPETADPLVRFVAQTLAEQIQDFYPQVFIEEDPLDPHLPYHAYKNDEMRVLIKLNITIGQHTLVDQFEWELNNPLNSPEDFAKQMTRELSLSGEFTTAIAHCIREQCQLFTKSLYITGHPFDGRPIDDADLKDAFLPSPLLSVFRAAQHAKEFAPGLWELSEIELDRAENSLSREQRRQKRTMNRRGGPALPDLKDRQRTVRTLVVSSVLPGAAESVDESRLFKRVEISTGRSGRRAAAGQKAGVDDSDLSESEESGPESPATSTMLMTGTSRTRGIRGAASAAQAAMRANVGRSTTPEPAALHHHETRTSARRLGTHEDSVGEGNSLIVKFKISREKFRQFERDRKARARAESTQQGSLAPGGRPSSQGSTPQGGTPAHGSMGPPPSTPGLGSASLPATASNGVAGTPQPPGAVDADHPPQPGQPGVSAFPQA